MAFNIPAHACEPPVSRDDPDYQGVIAVSLHGHPEEVQLRDEIERFLAVSGEIVKIQSVGIRDTDLYLIVTIGVGIATNLITDLVKYLAKRLRAEYTSKRTPVIYISSAYAPKKVFRLPEEERGAQEHFFNHPSQGDPQVGTKKE